MSEVCIHGLGYIGLPTAAMLANYGHDVTGVDTDPEIRESLEAGDVHIDEPGLRAFVTEAFDSGNFDVADAAEPAKYQIVCVPTPLDEETRQADLSYVEAAGEAIRDELRRGDTVILESTVPPRTTVDVLKPIVEESGLSAGSDFALVHSPETVLPGNVITELRENDRIVGGVNGVSEEAAVRLYDTFVEGDIVAAPNATTAEFVKLVQNTYRDVNVALANEIALLADDYEIDAREAIGLANRHPRVEVHQPGPGVGGHCLPLDPWFLGQGSDRLDLIAHAREVNEGMVDHVLDHVADRLDGAEKAKVAVLGVAYKGNVGDTRNSPGLAIARRLQELDADGGEPATERAPQVTTAASGNGETTERPVPNGGTRPVERIEVALHDGHVDDQTLSLEPLADTLEGADGVVIAADHDEYRDLEPGWVGDRLDDGFVLDTKGVLDVDAWTDAPVVFDRI